MKVINAPLNLFEGYVERFLFFDDDIFDNEDK